jgi:predicted acetyltransferase
MRLIPPDLRYAETFKRYVEDYRRAGDAERVSKYEAGAKDFPAYVESLRLAALGINLPVDKVPYHTFWLMDGDEVVGIVRVRPRPTPKIELYDGHIGYDVAPSHRGKGYGTLLLRMALVEARRLGLSRVFVNCAKTNVLSQRVIERCGGQALEEVFDEEKGRVTCRYELATSDAGARERQSTDSDANLNPNYS